MNIAVDKTSSDIQTIESANVQLKEYVNKSLADPKVVGDIDDNFHQRILDSEKSVTAQIGELSEETDIDKLLQMITSIINETEELTDLHLGVIRTTSTKPEIAFVGNGKSDKSHVILRDARFQSEFKDAKSKADDVPEATIVVAAGQLRGVLQMIKDCNSGDKERATKEAVGLFQEYKERLSASSSIEEREAIIHDMNTEMANVLRENNLVMDGKAIKDFDHKKLAKGMGLVRDLTNLLDDKHSSIVTVTDIGGGALQVSGTVPIRPLSRDLEKRYQEHEMKNWTKELNPFLRHSLRGPFIDKIKDGKHVVSSQLPVPGLRNAALEQTYVQAQIGDKSLVFEDKRMLRSGTPAHNNGEGDKKAKTYRDIVTAQNLEHMVAMSGGKEVDLTVLNSDAVVFGEKEIVEGVRGGIRYYKEKKGELSKLKGSKPGSDYSQKGVSVSHKKTKHVRDVVEAFEKRNGDSIQAICCKSGKDRTQAMITQNVLSTIENLKVQGLEIDVKAAQAAIVRSGHGNAVASGVGATKGIMGTKIGNVYTGLKGDSVLLEHKEQLKTKIANLNHVELNENFEVAQPAIGHVRTQIARLELDKATLTPAVMKAADKITRDAKRQTMVEKNRPRSVAVTRKPPKPSKPNHNTGTSA